MERDKLYGNCDYSTSPLFCLSTLIAVGELSIDADIDEADNWLYNKCNGNCDECPHKDVCLLLELEK